MADESLPISAAELTELFDGNPTDNRHRQTYLTFDPTTWSPLHLYRAPNDIVATAIRTSGSEGLGRQDIGVLMGINTVVKAGNRRVSHHICQVVKDSPAHFGQYQKMEGKYRCIKYFWKDEEPQNFSKLYDAYREIIGEDCPFKMGDVIKFPNTTLSTLRISDVSLNRLVFLLRSLEEERVIVTLNKCMKMVQHMELTGGYNFQIDKKSLLKCLHALEKKNLCRVFETAVCEDRVVTQIKVICHREIDNVNHPDVNLAIRTAIDSFHAEGRVFPHGQLRVLKKRTQTEDDFDSIVQNTQTIGDITREIVNLHWSQMRIEDRLTLYRLHMTDINRGGYVKEEVKDEDVTTIADDSAMDVDETGPLIPDIKAEPTSPNMNRTLLGLPNDCGVQSKMVRCAIIHEILYHFVYSFDNFEGLPNVYERFPPALSVDEIKAEEVPVYVDADTPTRFMPPLPPFSNAQQGWFMLQDFLNVFPLSVYVLLMPLPKNCPDVHNYLVDPFRRHTILGDLPLHIRMPLLKDKKFVKYLEHVILCLCSYGLMRQMPNPDVRRFNSAHSAVFYVAKEAILMDTSTSEKGYSTVSPAPHPDGYTQHHYKFKSEKDIQFYWHHLRAIALSTPLSFRQVKKGDETIQLNTSNHGSAQDARNNYRKYAMGTFDRSQIMGDPSEEYSVVLPIKPNDGCAGFACDLFVHLKRHWDLNPRPGEYISWFINKWRNDAENARDHVESRVEKLQSHWNSFIIALMPSDMEMVKRQKMLNTSSKLETVRTIRDSTHGRIKKLRPFALRMHKTPQEKASRGNKTKKRKLDEIDMLSETRRMFLRSRFSAKERDMLVLIRAVSFFLNPVYRFWLNPVVLRDIMHDLVPESRCKTVQSLMAAGVRELARPYRLDYMQRIVKILCTFDEMRNLREQLFNNPLVDPEEKRKFFLDAFLAANRLLFMESCDLPPCTASNEEFEEVIQRGCVSVITEPNNSDQIPDRSRQATTPQACAEGLAFNVLMAMLLSQAHGAEQNSEAPMKQIENMETLVEQLSGSALTEILEKLRGDGLIARNRPLEHLNLAVKSQATLSFYYRHFFNHKYHMDIIPQTIDAVTRLTKGDIISDIDAAGLIAAISVCYVNKKIELDLSVPENLLSIFEASDIDQMAGTKRLRYLENANLHLEKIAVIPSMPHEFGECCKLKEVADFTCPQLIPVEFIETPLSKERMEKLLEETPDKATKYGLEHVREMVRETMEKGVTRKEIDEKFSEEICPELLDEFLETLMTKGIVFKAGIDTERYVDMLHSPIWTVKHGANAFYAFPWTLASGKSHSSTLRWISEGIFFSIMGKPGVLLSDLIANYAFALQPSSLEKILQLLEKTGCIERRVETLTTMQLTCPFEGESVITKEAIYYLPTQDAIIRFAKCFEDVELAAALTAGPTKDDM